MGRRRHISFFFFFSPSGCENDSLPLVSSDGVKAERFAGSAERRRHRAQLLRLICVSSPRPSVSHPSVRPSVLAGSPCLQTRSTSCCAVTLCRREPFLSLVLCIALRKCSTPRSAGSGSEVGGVGGFGARPVSTLYLGPPFMSLSCSLSRVL